MKNNTSATIARANSTGWMIAPPAMAMMSRITPIMSSNLNPFRR